MTEEQKTLFAECVKAEINFHTEMAERYSKADVMLFKHLIELHEEAINYLTVLIL